MPLITPYKSNKRQALTLLIVGETRCNTLAVPGAAQLCLSAILHERKIMSEVQTLSLSYKAQNGGQWWTVGIFNNRCYIYYDITLQAWKLTEEEPLLLFK